MDHLRARTASGHRNGGPPRAGQVIFGENDHSISKVDGLRVQGLQRGIIPVSIIPIYQRLLEAYLDMYVYVCMWVFEAAKLAWRLRAVTSSTLKTRLAHTYLHYI